MTALIRSRVDLPGIEPEQAFAAMVDLTAQERWVIATRLYPVQAGARFPQVGSRMAAFTGIGGIGLLDTMTVTVYEPPERWVVAKDGDLLRGIGTMRVERTTGGCRAEWTNELTVPFGVLGRLAFLLARPVAAFLLGVCLRRLARQLREGALPISTEGREREISP